MQRLQLFVLFLPILFPSLVDGATYSLQLSKLQSDCGTLYTVVPGDDCWAIAGSAGITLAQLAALNPEMRCEGLGVGDGLCLQLPCSKTYPVAMGEWCAKIFEEQNTTLETILSLNPGFSCDELFPGQRLCLAPPVVDPPAPPSGPLPIELPLDPVPTVPCQIAVAVAEGDTCYQLATSNDIQLSQFTAMNANLNCSHLEAGDIACVRPACGSTHMVQNGEWCGAIELSYSLESGKLVELNPGLSCEALAPNQAVCVEPPEVEEPWETIPSYRARPNFGSFSNGESIPQSPLLDIQNTEDASKTMIGKMASQSDASHASSFDYADANRDGFLDLEELKVMARVNPSMTRGLDDVQDADDFAAQTLDTCDTNRDGKISKDEFMQAVTEARYASKDISAARSKLERRILPLLLLFGLFAAASITQIIGELQMNARLREQQIMDYMDVVFWDRESGAPEPKCAIYVYYSTSCAALGHHWSSHCSEGGEKVFDSSCRAPFAPGALGCGFLGCSSMCYKVSTEGCDCNCLDFTSEDGYYYTDTPHSETTEGGIAPCRTKCASLNGCTGFSLSPGPRDSTVTCKIFTESRPMRNREKRDRTASYKSVGGAVGNQPSDPGPPFRYSKGLSRMTLEEILFDQILGRWVSDAYGTQSSRLQGRTARNRTDQGLVESGSTNSTGLPTGRLQRRAPSQFDWRFEWPTTVKDQADSGTCTSHAISTVIEATVKRTYRRTEIRDMSPGWIHYCRSKKNLDEGQTFDDLRGGVSNSYLASSSCIGRFSDTVPPTCRPNNCGAQQYHDMPYITKYQEYSTPGWWHRWWNGPKAVDLSIVERMKEWLSTESPLYMSFSVHDGFMRYYLSDLEAYNGSGDLVFYDDNPRWAPRDKNSYGGHAMAVVGYGHHRRAPDNLDRLYWIVQNSWGTAGKNGFVFIELGSLSNTLRASTWGIRVSEGHYWFATELPSNR